MGIPVLTVGELLLRMGIRNGNTAATAVISQTASERSVLAVTDEYRNRLESYLASMHHAKRMLAMGILIPEDYAVIETITAEKYGISSYSLYRGIDLLYKGVRGNMPHCEEVTQCQEP
jgi:hypothetical protein